MYHSKLKHDWNQLTPNQKPLSKKEQALNRQYEDASKSTNTTAWPSTIKYCQRLVILNLNTGVPTWFKLPIAKIQFDATTTSSGLGSTNIQQGVVGRQAIIKSLYNNITVNSSIKREEATLPLFRVIYVLDKQCNGDDEILGSVLAPLVLDQTGRITDLYNRDNSDRFVILADYTRTLDLPETALDGTATNVGTITWNDNIDLDYLMTWAPAGADNFVDTTTNMLHALAFIKPFKDGATEFGGGNGEVDIICNSQMTYFDN